MRLNEFADPNEYTQNHSTVTSAAAIVVPAIAQHKARAVSRVEPISLPTISRTICVIRSHSPSVGSRGHAKVTNASPVVGTQR